MSTTTIRRIEGDEILTILHSLSTYAFRASPPLPDIAESAEWRKSHPEILYVAAFDDRTAVACAGASPLTQNVRGALFKMAGIHNVATHPAARRKGYAKGVLKHTFALLRQQGHVFSCLWPFRELFYEKMGYVTFPLARRCTLHIPALAPLLDRDLGGDVDLTVIGDGFSAYRDYLFAALSRLHGMAVFDVADTVGAQRNRFWLALARVEGEVVGAMLYELRGEQIADFTMIVRRFLYRTSQGKYLLLAWIAHHTDQASKVELWLPAFEHPETWLDDLKISAEPVPLSPMGRVLDVAKMGGMQTGAGRFTARLSDPICPWNNGVWSFETANGMLEASPGGKAQCDLGMQAIAALAYGTRDPADFSIRGWGAPSPELQETMRAMFPARIPYLHESF